MVTNLSEKQLKTLIKKSVREALGIEFMKFRALILPYASEEEQKDIERRYGKPVRKSVRTSDVEI